LRTIRRWLREFLIWLPSGLGDTVLLPRLQRLYDQLPFLDWRTKRYARSEARRLLRAISSGVEECTIVYDTKVNGLAFGTVVNFVAIARFLTANSIYTNLYFLKSDTIIHDGTDDQYEIGRFIDSSIVYAKELLRSDITNIDRIGSETLNVKVRGWSENYLLFDDFTKNRRPFFRDCFNVFNYLMASSESDLQNRCLYSPSEFSNCLPRSFEGRAYVAWACRYSTKCGDAGRQTMKEEFRKIYSYLRIRFPQSEIMIVSDAIGCRHYLSLSKELGIEDLLFSKDYSPDFLGDTALVMNSQMFFSFRAGGIGQVPLLSKMPFEMLGPLMNEIPLNKNEVTSWQTESQSFVVLRKHQFEDDRESDLNSLGFQERANRGSVG
jgi:hypothetical protein